MAKLIRSNSKTPLVEGDLTFTADKSRFSIGLTSRESHSKYDLYLSETEAQRFAVFVAERLELTDYETMR